MIPPNHFDMSFPLTGGCSRGLDSFRCFFKQQHTTPSVVLERIDSVWCVHVVIPFILDVRFVDVPAGVTQEERHTRFLHLPSAVFALVFRLLIIMYVCVYVCMVTHTYSKSMDQPCKVANPARGQLNNKYFNIPCPRSHLRIWSLARRVRQSRPAPAVLISILRLNMVLTYGIPPEFRGGVHLFL